MRAEPILVLAIFTACCSSPSDHGGSGHVTCDGDIEFQVTNSTNVEYDVTYDLAGCPGAGTLAPGPGTYETWLKDDADLMTGDVISVTAQATGMPARSAACTVSSAVGDSGLDYVRVQVDVTGTPACDCGTDEYALGSTCM